MGLGATAAQDRRELGRADAVLGEAAGDALVEGLLGLRVGLGLAGCQGCGLAGADAVVAPFGLLCQDLGAARGEGSQERGVVEAVDLGGAGARVDVAPADVQALGQLGAENSVVDAVGCHGVGVQPLGVQRGPATIRAERGVLDQDVGVPLGVPFAAGAVVERGADQAEASVVGGAVVAAPDADGFALEVGENLADGGVPGRLDLAADVRAAAGGEQAYRLDVGKGQVEGGDARVDSFVRMAGGLLVGVAYSSHTSRPRTVRHSRSAVLADTFCDRPSAVRCCCNRSRPSARSASSTPREAASLRSSATSGVASSLERGSARHSGATRCSPVTGSWPANSRWTALSEATPARPDRSARAPVHQPGDSPLAE